MLILFKSFLAKSVKKDLYQLYANHFQTLSPPAYILLAVFNNPFVSKYFVSWSVSLIDWFFINLNTAVSSAATKFSSKAPYFIPSATSSNNLFSASAPSLPALNMSSTAIFTESIIDALPPISPLFMTNILANVKFLLCVAGDNTVLPYWTATFGLIKRFLYKKFCARSSRGPFIVVISLIKSIGPYSLLVSVFNNPIPSIFPTCLTPLPSLSGVIL